MRPNRNTQWLAGTIAVVATTMAAVTSLPGTVYAQDNHQERHDADWKRDHRDNDRHDNDRRDRDRDARNRDNDRRDNDRRDRDNHNRDRDDHRNGRPWVQNSYQESQHRQDTKNEWRNIALGAGGIGILGLIEHNPTITFAGAAGALYSLDRYEQDRKSQSNEARARAAFFSRPYFERDGHRFERRDVYRDGHHYYQFVRR